jgi:hypothetical protein
MATDRGAAVAVAAVAGVTAILLASGLTVPHLFFYDETVFLLPLLVLWEERAVMRPYRRRCCRWRP